MNARRTCAVLTALGLALAAAPSFGDDLPSVATILERYVEAVGGEKTIRATKGMHQVGTMDMPAMGMSAEMEVYLAPPNKMVMKMNLPQVGAINTGYDGTVGWVDNPMTGPMIMEGDQLEQAVDQADFYSDLNYDKRYATMETVGVVDFAGESAYKVKLVGADGKETLEYFSVDSGLKIGFEAEQTSEMGAMMVVTELRDYKDFDGRMVPTTSVAKMMGMEMTMKVDSISFDELDPSIFELPENIKTLVGKAEGK
jgi:hypothetical protein